MSVLLMERSPFIVLSAVVQEPWNPHVLPGSLLMQAIAITLLTS